MLANKEKRNLQLLTSLRGDKRAILMVKRMRQHAAHINFTTSKTFTDEGIGFYETQRNFSESNNLRLAA